MNILVVGGAGYIGSHVAKEFLERGHRVTVYDNLSSGLRENMESLAAFGGGPVFVHGDIHDYPNLVQVMRGGFDTQNASYDALIHLAASKAAGESMLKPEKYTRNNIAGTINLLNAASETGIGNIVFSSSALVYGEPEYLPLDERHPTKPDNFYGFTKLETERLLGWYEKLKGIHFASLRYFNAAGYDVQGSIRGLEQKPANLLPVIMETACGIRKELEIFGDDYDTPDGTCIRDYVHVSDLAAGHAAALDYIVTNKTSLIANLGSEKGISVTEVVEAARKITGKPVPARITGRRSGDPVRLIASAALARELLGWKARYSDIETLITTSWNIYKEYQL